MVPVIRGIAVAAAFVGILSLGLMPRNAEAQCPPWPGGPLDDDLYASLHSVGNPLQGQGDIDRSAARALYEAWRAAGEPSNFDASPYSKPGPDCGDPTVASTGASLSPTATPTVNNDNNDNGRNNNDNERRRRRSENDNR